MKFISSKEVVKDCYESGGFVIIRIKCNYCAVGRVIAIEEDRAKVSIRLSGGVMMNEWIKF